MKAHLSFSILLILLGQGALASEVLQDFDKLGGNEILLQKAKALEPEKDIAIVQDRLVQRNFRFELTPEMGSVVGGDTYAKTHLYGGNLHFHFSPYVSVGVKYNAMGSEMTPEANSLIDIGVSGAGRAIVPEIVYVRDQTMALVNVYPFYGKLKVFDRIAHFDVYGLFGYGSLFYQTINKEHSGTKSTWTGGIGVGFWITNHLTARWELRYQNFRPERSSGEANVHWTVSSLQVGVLF